MNKNQPNTLAPDYFAQVYAANPDPWDFKTSAYEKAKYAATVAALPRSHYAEAFEIGCSLGELTALLALRCGHLLAVDVSDVALAQARQRCTALPQVELRHLRVPDEFPARRFDLIVLSEVGYYWARPDLEKAIALMVSGLKPGGQLLLVHWTPPVHDYPLTGDEVHELFLTQAQPGGALRHLSGYHHEKYRLDLLEKR